MTWLYILLGIFAFFTWLLTRKIRIGLSYCRKFSLYAKLLFIKIEFPSEKPVREKTAKKKKKKSEKPQEKSNKTEGTAKRTVGEYIEIFTDALKITVSKLKKYLFLEKYVLKLTVGADDPHKTAVLYGNLSGAVGNMWALVNNLKRRHKSDKSYYSEVKPDFLYESIDFYTDIVLSVRVWQALSLGKTALDVMSRLRHTNKTNNSEVITNE